MSGARFLAVLAVAGLAAACSSTTEPGTSATSSSTSAAAASSSGQTVTKNGVTGTVLATGFAPAGIDAESTGETDVVFRKITIAPGSDTGWHYHNGELIATITAGTLTREFADCTEQVSKAGDAILEPEGNQNVHIGRNLGTVPVEMYVTYIIPKGSKLAIDAPAPACAAK
ncbi:cupin domain-containing protein [Smaragdicoccus niigatensis]|uniref:cupin domain-containing protein n=1 Tax=Smaragdicoccus niigatensis TaxID=359359 RepID=UPI00037174CA|nr:cupin domain-containing protein [Smaragdicoccus niigatensis]